MPPASCSPSSRLPSTPPTSARLRGLCGVESGETRRDVRLSCVSLVVLHMSAPNLGGFAYLLGEIVHIPSAPTITKPARILSPHWQEPHLTVAAALCSGEDPDEDVVACPFCEVEGSEWELDCSSCSKQVPFCIASGKEAATSPPLAGVADTGGMSLQPGR